MPQTAGYSGTPLARKLGIKAGHRVATVVAPPHFPDLLDDLPTSVRLESNPAASSAPGARAAGAYDVVVCFVADRSVLSSRLDHGHRLLDWNGGLWMAWPKQSSPLATDLRESDVRAAGLGAGLVDNKICAIDGDWSGLRLVYRRQDRPGHR